MKYKTFGICALVTFIIFVFIAFGSSIASVVLFLFNPIQQVHQISTLETYFYRQRNFAEFYRHSSIGEICRPTPVTESQIEFQK